MTESIPYNQARYLKSAPGLQQLPADKGREVAFIGRSNAGKSSAMNAITGIKGLARTSKTPGRTQMINFFALGQDDKLRLVDLPGYGYAKVPRMIKERWDENINNYFQHRQSLVGLVIVMDVRHPLKELDQQVLDWSIQFQVPVHILLTKTDKLTNSAARKTLKEVQAALQLDKNLTITVQLFSSLDRTGLEEAREQLAEWLLGE